jgi:predicted DCC family thiol-disulfide oxidoreductase YuxK
MSGTGKNDGSATLLFYDRNCPVCRREIALLTRWDRQGALRAVDIEEGASCAARHGLSKEALDARLHAVLPDGSAVSGMAAVRAAYRAVGKGWMAAPSGWPVARPFFDAAYRWFARHRKQIGRMLDR